MLVLLLAVASATPDVVLVGNSYTARNDLERALNELLRATCQVTSATRVTALTQGGATWSDHVGWLARDPDWSDAFAWPRDVFVLQEQSQIPGFPETDPAWVLSRGALADLVEAADGDALLFETWGRREGDPDNPSLYPDYATMQDRLTAGYRAYADAQAALGQPVTIAPVGQAFRAVYDASAPDPLAADAAFAQLYAGDGSHPSPAGTWLAATVLTTAITGRVPVDYPMVGVPDAVRAALLPFGAGAVLDDPFGPDAYPFAWTWDAWRAAHGDAPISEDWRTPWVRIDGEVSVVDVAVGGAHEHGLGEGRLVVDGGDLTVSGQLTLGQEGRGFLEVWGGAVQAARVTLGAEAGATGAIRLRGGALTVDRVDVAFGQGSVRAEAGDLYARGPIAGAPVIEGGALHLSAADTAISGGLTVQPGATLALDADASAVVGGVATLDGAILDVEAAAGGRVLVVATSLTVEAAVAPAGFSLAVEPDPAGQRLVLVDDGALDTDDPENPDIGGPDSSCGCVQGRAAGGWVTLGGLLVGLLRRRR